MAHEQHTTDKSTWQKKNVFLWRVQFGGRSTALTTMCTADLGLVQNAAQVSARRDVLLAGTTLPNSARPDGIIAGARQKPAQCIHLRVDCVQRPYKHCMGESSIYRASTTISYIIIAVSDPVLLQGGAFRPIVSGDPGLLPLAPWGSECIV